MTYTAALRRGKREERKTLLASALALDEVLFFVLLDVAEEGRALFIKKMVKEQWIEK